MSDEKPRGPVCDAKALDRMNIPASLRGVSYAHVNDALKTPIVRYFEKLDENLANGVGLFFFGPSGLGKTSAAIVMLKAGWERRRTGLFVSVKDVRQAIREDITYDGAESVLERAKNVDILVLDDLALDDFKDWTFGINAIEHLLRNRSMRGKTTIFTTRLTGLEIKDGSPSFFTSLQGSFVGILVTGEDQKAAAAKRLRQALGVS